MIRKHWPVALLVLTLFFCCLLFPSIRKVRNGAGQQLRVNVKSIALAMYSYAMEHGDRLPPAVLRSKDGKPLLSWRVLLLPYLEQKPLFQQFKLDEAWDSPHNQALVDKMPRTYWAEDEVPLGLTRFQVFVGPGTAFESKDGISLDDFPDGTWRTISVVEAAKPVPWSKPEDLVYDPDGPLPALGGVHTIPAYHVLEWTFGKKPVFYVGFVNGSVLRLPTTLDEKRLRALITRNGGEAVEPRDLVK
jgi:hypothetical protein